MEDGKYSWWICGRIGEVREVGDVERRGNQLVEADFASVEAEESSYANHEGPFTVGGGESAG